AHGDILIAPMRTHLRHHHRAVPLALECATQPFLAQALMIFPGVIEEVDAGIQRLIDNLRRLRIAVRGAQVVSATSQRRNFQTSASQRSLGYLCAGLPPGSEARSSQHKSLNKRSSGHVK